MLAAILFIIALFTAYAVTALILTYRNIKREEKALDEQAYGDCVFVHREMRGEDRRPENRGGGLRQPTTLTGTNDIARHGEGI